jgi:hypothetical protein
MSWNATRFALKHAMASIAVMAGMAAVATVSFLVGVMMISGRNEDSSTLHSTLLFGLLGGWASVVIVLAPITAATELLCERSRLRIWWQIPISVFLLSAVGLGLAFVNVASTGASFDTSLKTAVLATAALLVPLGVYWWAAQSADWLLRSGGHLASRMWPTRFAALARQPELVVSGRSVRIVAQFRVRDHVSFTVGRDPVLVLVGNTVDGTVRGGMRVFASRGTTRLSATITSVEQVDGSAASGTRLLLAPDEHELDLWKSAAAEGQVVQVA